MKKWKFYYTGAKNWDSMFARRNFYFTPAIAIDYDWFKVRVWYFAWLSWMVAYFPEGIKPTVKNETSTDNQPT